MPKKYAKRKKLAVKRRKYSKRKGVAAVPAAAAPAALHVLRWYQAPGEPLPVLQQYVAGEWKAVPLTTVW